MGTEVHSGHARASGAASSARGTSPRRQGLRRLLATRPSRASISVIVVCHNEKQYLERTLKSLGLGLPPVSEVIVIDDQSTDGCCDPLLNDPAWRAVRVIRTPERLGVSRSRNFGAAESRGDILVFSDAHCEAPPGWGSAVAQALQDERTGAVSPAISVLDQDDPAQGFGMHFTDPGLGVEWLGRTGDDPYPVPLLCGCFIALRRDVFFHVGGFDPGMLLWGSEDMEFSLHLWSRGYECRVLPGLAVAHRFSSSFSYPVHWEPLYNKLRMGLVHFGPRRCLELMSQSRDDVHLPAVWDRLTRSDVWSRKQSIQQVRVHDDTWFFEKFAHSGLPTS